MSAHELGVFDGFTRVGTVNYESAEERFSFRYDPQWPELEVAYAISPHIPMTGAAASSNTVRRFIENLLPEGRALDIVSITHQVSKNNVYGLIRQLGQETSGALSFLSGDVAPAAQPTAKRSIRREELKQKIDDRSRVPFAAWDGRIRMSIAGHQDKLAVYLGEDGKQMFLVEGSLASTHIIKPEPDAQRLPMLVANEHFSMSLARRIGLEAAPVSILRVPDPILVIERFDRLREPNRVRRLHIIDGCQALDVPVAYKYERNFGAGRDVSHIRDGVSFKKLFSVADHSTQKAATRLALLRWALFNYLIGNCDAHGKNVSFFCRPEGLALAPFYDLISVVQYPGLDHELAMAYGDEFLLDDVSAFNWADFAQATDTPRTLLTREMRRMGKAAAVAAARQASDEIYIGEEKAFVSHIVSFVQEQARKLVDMAAHTMKVEAGLF